MKLKICVIMVLAVLLLVAVYTAALSPVKLPDPPVRSTAGTTSESINDSAIKEPTTYEEPEDGSICATDAVYVSLGGDDTHEGSRNYPFQTIKRAIDSGADTIYIFAGVYKESIDVSRTGGKIEILAKPLNGNNSVVLDLSVDMDMIKDSNSGLVKAEYQCNEENFLLKAFITKTEPLIYEDGYMTTGYSCNLWSGDKKLIPVLSLQECLESKDTWYYDGVFIYANAPEGRYQLSDGTKEYGIRLSWFQQVKLTGITVKYAQKDAVRLRGCIDSEISRCSFGYSGLYCGLALESSSATVKNCEAMFNRADGLNIHGVSTADFIGCVSHDNGDDGLSHHDASGGMVIGGEYYNNVKAGIASPTFGSRNYISDVFVHNNGIGIYAVTTEDGDYPPCSVSNCLISGNGVGISSIRYRLDCWNVVFSGNNQDVKETEGGLVNIYS